MRDTQFGLELLDGFVLGFDRGFACALTHSPSTSGICFSNKQSTPSTCYVHHTQLPLYQHFAICGDNTISMQTPLPLLDAKLKHTWPPPSEKHGHPTQPADFMSATHGSTIAAIQSTSLTQNTQEHATPSSSSINI